MSGPYKIVTAAPEHVRFIPAIERAAAALFPQDDLPGDLREQTTPEDILATAQREERLWVALSESGEPVGYALAEVEARRAHLAEMDVVPEHGRRGIGSALVREVASWARRRGCEAVTLTTFSHLPWNAPFYERLGFRRVRPEDLPPELAQALEADARNGLDIRKRVAMRLELDAAEPAGPAGRRSPRPPRIKP